MALKVTNKAGMNNPVNNKKKVPSSKKSNVSSGQLHSAVTEANIIGERLDNKLSFNIDAITNKVMVKIIDQSTGNVVRLIPPGEMLRMVAHLKQLKVLNDRVIGAAESVILDQNDQKN